MVVTLIYIVSIIYCLYKLAKRSNDRSLGGGIGETPGLDTLMVVVLAPFLAITDLIISGVNLIRKK
jgi:hypothetical protein